MKSIVLVVDDSLMRRHFIVNHLRTFGFDFVEAKNADEAMDHLTAGNIALVIADSYHADLASLEMMERIRMIPEYQATPVLLIVHPAHTEHLSSIMKAGYKDHLKIPFESHDLAKKVERLIGLGG
jgi:PleD family two-component response regulator